MKSIMGLSCLFVLSSGEEKPHIRAELILQRENLEKAKSLPPSSPPTIDNLIYYDDVPPIIIVNMKREREVDR